MVVSVIWAVQTWPHLAARPETVCPRSYDTAPGGDDQYSHGASVGGPLHGV